MQAVLSDSNPPIVPRYAMQAVLSDCNATIASFWIVSSVDGTVSQKPRAGGYPGLCLSATPMAPSPGPGPHPHPHPSPPCPLPSNLSIALDVDGNMSNSTSAASMVSFNFDWHENGEEVPTWINSSALLIKR